MAISYVASGSFARMHRDDGQYELIECINRYHLSLGQLAFELSHLRSRAGFQIRRIVSDFETASRIFSFNGRGILSCDFIRY
jgi:hypothetical protein